MSALIMKHLESNKLLFCVEYLVALGSAIYLFAFGWIHRKHRSFILSIGAHFGFRPRWVEPELPIQPLREVLPERISLCIPEPASANGNVTFLELCVLSELVRTAAPKAIFELGTFDGRTTLSLAANTAPDTRLWTIDLPSAESDKTALKVVWREQQFIDKDASGSRYQNRPEATRITQLFGDTGTFDFSPYHGQIDFVFIDASHAYDYVLNDSKIALKLLRNGRGTIVWHDYGEWIGVTGALNELRRQPPFVDLRRIEGTSLAVVAFA